MPSGVYRRTEETKRKISLTLKGHEVLEETRQKISLSNKGKIAWNKDKTGIYSEETIKKISEGMKGKKITFWKGNKAEYKRLHVWVYKNLGKANHCEHCGLNEVPKGKKRYFQWANKSHRYFKNLNDWIQLCLKCHYKYDEK